MFERGRPLRQGKRLVSKALFTFSMLAFVATLAVWAESFFPPTYQITVRRPDRVVVVQSLLGQAVVSVVSDTEIIRAGEQIVDYSPLVVIPHVPARLSMAQIAPLVFKRHALELSRGSTTAWIPFWWFAILFGVVPGLVVQRRVRALHKARTRAKHGLCVQCGYDLRGSPNGLCPECNTPFDSAAVGIDQQGSDKPVA